LKKILTIGIPSYERLEPLRRLVSQILDSGLSEHIELLIIDDGRKKTVLDFLNSFMPNSRGELTVLENSGNVGYALTFFRMFEECKTKYLLMMADDDFIDPSGIRELLNCLHAESPDFLSPQFHRMGILERGIAESRRITPSEFRASSNHAPGLVYRVSSCVPFLDNLKSRAIRGKADSTIYPQVALVANLIGSEKNCMWTSFPTAYEGSGLPSAIFDVDNSNYWDFASRCRQLVDFEELLMSLTPTESSNSMLKCHRLTAYNEISSSLSVASPTLWASFNYIARLAAAKEFIKQLTIFILLKKFHLSLRAILKGRL